MSDTRKATALVGAVLGSYRICSEITSGGMGSVYRAQHVLLGRPAAIKLLRPELTGDDALVQRFANEARAVSACKHPGIVEVYDYGYTPDGCAYIAMELLEGESLGRRLQRARLGEPEAIALAYGIASALKAAHAAGVIHRDLKPDNVFLIADPDGGERTKVLDFGIAKLADTSSRHTQTGALIGTPLYMAPEQARAAAAIDHRADLYSLGCILYHMLVGRPPFVAAGAGEVIAQQLFTPPDPPSQHAPVSQALEHIVLRLLEKEPDRRFASASELVAALAALDAQHAGRPTWPSGQIAMSESATALPTRPIAGTSAPALQAQLHCATDAIVRRRSRLPLVGAAVLVVVGAIVAYSALSGTNPPADNASAGNPSAGSNAPSARPPQPPLPPAPPPAPTTPPAEAADQPASPAPPATAPAPRPPTQPHHLAVKHASQTTAQKPGSTAGSGSNKVIDVNSAQTGPHTPGGSPMETTIDIGKHRQAPSAPPRSKDETTP